MVNHSHPAFSSPKVTSRQTCIWARGFGSTSNVYFKLNEIVSCFVDTTSIAQQAEGNVLIHHVYREGKRKLEKPE